ncbi:hypothetical protein K458DRAFT_330070 [Lentithecium fluviatile CBS 122367]|uniref:Galactose oxidase n=1 Tax=Lentithecium fluviatile CBS 122367 TaxID=1168545 RepID=A0A6G1JHB3_9PLEO|nr:hypothetical protein K458DRAFT_330070 [Lentithecium fluviatile CBS 122367]
MNLSAKMNSHKSCLIAMLLSPGLATCQIVSGVPPDYFCARYGHTATRRGDSVFVYGGQREPLAFDGSLLVRVDLSRPWNAFEGGPPMSFVDNNEMSTDPPSLVQEGGLFLGNDGDIFVYGGGAANFTLNTSSPQPKSFVDNNLRSITQRNESWSYLDLGLEATHSPQLGASAQAGEQGLAFYFNGIIGDEVSREPHPRMIVLDLREEKARNVSTAAISPTDARVGATLQYIPGVGKKGVLVLVGGGVRQRSDDANTHELGGTMAPLNTIHVLDIASLDHGEGTWYQQKTNGRTPAPRADICAASIASPDGTGHHIYMFAGRNQTNAFDEVWVLSLPQFRWTKVFNGTHPNYGGVCQMVGTKQMLVLGGNNVEEPRPQCDKKYKIFLFELTNLKWTPTYVKDSSPYRVPKAVFEWIGGTGMGEANMTEPEGGFDSQGLAELFKTTQSASLRYGRVNAGMRMGRGLGFDLLTLILMLSWVFLW